MRADAKRNREKVLYAAREALADHGALAQIDDIASRAGVGVGTVYRHFPTKDALVEELVRQKFAAFAANAREEVAGDDPEGLFALMSANARVLADDAALRQVALGSFGAPAPPGEELQELIEHTATLIARGKRAGVLRDDLEVLDVPLLMTGVCASMERGEDVWRRHLELAVDALRAR